MTVIEPMLLIARLIATLAIGHRPRCASVPPSCNESGRGFAGLGDRSAEVIEQRHQLIAFSLRFPG